MADKDDTKPVDACFDEDVPASKYQPRRKKTWFQKYGEFLTGDNCERGPAQRKAVEKTGNFLSMLIGAILLLGMVVAFGVWGIAVIAIIVFMSMLTGRKP